MASHWEHLSGYVPRLAEGTILDLGSGKGGFLVTAAQHGARAVGLELNPAYIEETLRRAQEAGVLVSVQQGKAEQLPFADESFDFINISEVIEHIQDPAAMLREVQRVLKPGGCAYMSVPNRFGMKDPHFHLYIVNWLPRAWSDAFIGLCGKHKDYANQAAGEQRLREMHYYTYGQIISLVHRSGLKAEDIRAMKIRRRFSAPTHPIALAAYHLLRPWYFDTFHLLLRKSV